MQCQFSPRYRAVSGDESDSKQKSAREQWALFLHISMTVINILLSIWLLNRRESSMRPTQVFERIVSWSWSAITLPCGFHHVWYWLCSLVSVLALIVVGILSGFLRPGRPPEGRSTSAIFRTFFVTFLAPGLAEELWFRAVLLPQGAEAKQIIAQVVINQIAFCCYHLDIFHTQRVFRDWRFLLLATLLGLACTFSYLATQGSVWPSAIIHWLCVWIWLNFMGGEDRVLGIWHGDPELSDAIAGYNERNGQKFIDDWFVDRKNDILWIAVSKGVINLNVDVFYEGIVSSLSSHLQHIMPYRAVAIDEIPRSAGKIDKVLLDRRKEQEEEAAVISDTPDIPHTPSLSLSTISTRSHATCAFGRFLLNFRGMQWMVVHRIAVDDST